jgi:hypothetical protein
MFADRVTVKKGQEHIWSATYELHVAGWQSRAVRVRQITNCKLPITIYVMPDRDVLVPLFVALLEQTKAVRDLKIQTESLKQMMFEHRPAFIPAFEEQVQKISSSPALKQLDSLISQLEQGLRALKTA